MIIATVPPSRTNVATLEIAHDDLLVDSRVMPPWDRYGWSFHCKVEGNILTVTRLATVSVTDADAGTNRFHHTIKYTSTRRPQKIGWSWPLHFRLYNPAVEEVPDFHSGSYTYWGLEGEQAPHDTVRGFIHPSVTSIQMFAFSGCRHMVTCTMGDQVKTIQLRAFADCTSMKSIQLSSQLQSIGANAFINCKALDALFLPPALRDVGDWAFAQCMNLRILVLPPDIDLERVGLGVALHSHALLTEFRGLRMQYERNNDSYRIINNHEVNHWLKHRFDHRPLLQLCMTTMMIESSTCTSDSVASSLPQRMRNILHEHGNDCAYHIDSEDHSLMPLHILAMHPQSQSQAILTALLLCLDANPCAAFTPDRSGKTPLDYLWENGNNVEGIVSIIQALCQYR